MSEEFNTSLPSTRTLQNHVKEQQAVEVQLLTSEKLSGRLLWQDPQCLCLEGEGERQTLIWRQAVAYVRLKP